MEQQNEICLLVEKEAPSQRNTHETSNNNLANAVKIQKEKRKIYLPDLGYPLSKKMCLEKQQNDATVRIQANEHDNTKILKQNINQIENKPPELIQNKSDNQFHINNVELTSFSLNFLKKFKKSLSKMTIKDLEELIVVKIVENLHYKSDLKRLKLKVEQQYKTIDKMSSRTFDLEKMIDDMLLVHTRLEQDLKTRNEPVRPVKFTRSVALQAHIPLKENQENFKYKIHPGNPLIATNRTITHLPPNSIKISPANSMNKSTVLRTYPGMTKQVPSNLINVISHPVINMSTGNDEIKPKNIVSNGNANDLVNRVITTNKLRTIFAKNVNSTDNTRIKTLNGNNFRSILSKNSFFNPNSKSMAGRPRTIIISRNSNAISGSDSSRSIVTNNMTMIPKNTVSFNNTQNSVNNKIMLKFSPVRQGDSANPNTENKFQSFKIFNSNVARKDIDIASTSSASIYKNPNNFIYDRQQIQNSSETQVAQKFKFRRNYDWTVEKEFTNMEDGIIYITSLEIWSKLYPVNTKYESGAVYRCNLTKFRGAQCEAKMKLVMDNLTPNRIVLYRTENCEHTHDRTDNLTTRNVGLHIKTIIREQTAKHKTAKEIMDHLNEEVANRNINIYDLPSSSKLTLEIKRAREQFYGLSKI